MCIEEVVLKMLEPEVKKGSDGGRRAAARVERGCGGGSSSRGSRRSPGSHRQRRPTKGRSHSRPQNFPPTSASPSPSSRHVPQHQATPATSSTHRRTTARALKTQGQAAQPIPPPSSQESPRRIRSSTAQLRMARNTHLARQTLPHPPTRLGISDSCPVFSARIPCCHQSGRETLRHSGRLLLRLHSALWTPPTTPPASRRSHLSTPGNHIRLPPRHVEWTGNPRRPLPTRAVPRRLHRTRQVPLAASDRLRPDPRPRLAAPTLALAAPRYLGRASRLPQVHLPLAPARKRTMRPPQTLPPHGVCKTGSGSVVSADGSCGWAREEWKWSS